MSETLFKTIAFNKAIPINLVRNFGFKTGDKFFLKNETLVGKLTGQIPVYKPPKTDLDKEIANLHQVDGPN